MHNGPLFETEPGWGGRLNAWLRANKLFALCIGALVIVLIVFVAIKGAPNSQDLSTIPPLFTSPTVTPPLVLSETVRKGDSYTMIARRAVMSTATLSSHFIPRGAFLYAETRLAQDLQSQPLHIGGMLTYPIESIWQYFDAYESLSPKQKAQWEFWASRVKF